MTEISTVKSNFMRKFKTLMLRLNLQNESKLTMISESEFQILTIRSLKNSTYICSRLTFKKLVLCVSTSILMGAKFKNFIRVYMDKAKDNFVTLN